MTSQNVTCPECSATPDVPCRAGYGPMSNKVHHERVERARAWQRLFRMAEELGCECQDGEPDLQDVEHLAHFGNRSERQLASKILTQAEILGYTEPGDAEAA